MPSPASGTPTTLRTGTSDTMLALGTGATVIAARKVARTAAATGAGPRDTPYIDARKTSAAPWKSALPGRLIEAASGRISR